jgi:hypothetical protein
MDKTLLILLLGAASSLVFAIFMHCRNSAVYRERGRIIDEINRLNGIDIDAGRPYSPTRYRAFNEVSYDEMVWKFWIPVQNFYRNHRCLS